MKRGIAGSGAPWLMFAVAWLLAVALPAQEVVVHHQVDERDVCSVQMTPYAGAARLGGLGFFHVRVQSQDMATHVIGVQFRSQTWQGHNVQGERTLALAANESGSFFLPLPSLGRSGFEVTITIDGKLYVEHIQASSNRGNSALLVTQSPGLEPAMLSLAQRLWPGDQRHQPGVTLCRPETSPADWRLFTAFDLVVIDGRSEIGRPLQAALRRYVHAGGRLLALGPDRLPAGALRERLEAVVGTDTVLHGLGSMTVTPRLTADLGAVSSELSRRADALPVWPLADGLQQEQHIPGLDDAPVLAFLLVILLFAIAVGPVNFFLLRKRRQPMLALVTVPALGFGTTLLMFAYAIINDGFGVRGVERSWSLLDQQTHEVASIASRTLFAGLSPGEFDLGDDSLLLAPRSFQRSDRRSRHRWSYSADTGMVDGAVLPARTTTPLVSARQGTARERLRVRQLANGDLELLTDGGVVPVGPVLLRGFDGQYWFGSGATIARCGASSGRQQVETMRRELRIFTTRVDGNDAVASLDHVAASLLPRDELDPGSYLTEVAQAPWVPEHGLAVDYETATHFVVGRLAQEDFVR